jgi:hypothetical protein
LGVSNFIFDAHVPVLRTTWEIMIMLWHNFSRSHDIEYIIIMMCYTDTKYVPTKSWYII